LQHRIENPGKVRTGFELVARAHADERLGTRLWPCETREMAEPRPNEIVIAPYDPAWTQWFDEIAAVVWPAVADVALRLDHIGSTAVPGLAAKPIIDIDIVVARPESLESVPQRLSEIGYEALGDLGVVGREAFDPLHPERLPEHHLYLVVENNKAHLDHWLLRDHLRLSAEARARYATAKQDNAWKSHGDLKVYTARKAALVAEMLTAARSARGLPPEQYWIPSATEVNPQLWPQTNC
jgi:GrpB-like predicted nucleotidyltransferase (UPF0157 family)